MRQFARVLLPVSAVEGGKLKRPELRPVHAPEVQGDAVRVRAWSIKRFHAAMFTKNVFRYASIECVLRQRIASLHQSKLRSWHDQVLETDHGTDGAIAFMNNCVVIGIGVPFHRAAMTSAGFDAPGHRLNRPRSDRSPRRSSMSPMCRRQARAAPGRSRPCGGPAPAPSIRQ